jgi:hypothetical protein
MQLGRPASPTICRVSLGAAETVEAVVLFQQAQDPERGQEQQAQAETFQFESKIRRKVSVPVQR